MRRFLVAGMWWTSAWGVLLIVALLLSHGEPVCEGPLILSVDESFPPQCDDPTAALPLVGAAVYLLGFVPTMVGTAIAGARHRSSADAIELGRVRER
jgi:hypothetical protein